jgi:putative peptide zinc metalloprotease protein
MTQAAPAAADLERRKHLRLRLRKDLVIDAQRYEGRTYYVLKDPVSLRYYRLKENEHYLLQFLDGEHTLEDAQKAYESYYRPERLKLEDLEAFGQQLLTAGLAQNESPKAGKQLFDRRKKRLRTEWMQTLTNILYIKIPVIDPDRLLKRMLPWCGFVFSPWFAILATSLMLGAVFLVATHFDTFLSKLPNYHEFFQFKTIVYLWGALAVVKVIHEFGHGVSCKKYGGEVHEMGLLFLCFSPAMYCNVSDAWTLPNKWHRMIISFAGIYIELIIASISTFVWWNTPTQPFVNNMALSLMIVCSVSTVFFNANPLMRYDGYYVLADWLEIPNLRERSNRFLSNLALEYCLGVEVQPEGYMELWRKILFVSYAILSYVYRWVVTFAILWFMYNFLRPYKLEVISSMLALASLGSLIGWPIYNLCKNIYKRGRLPDMKRARVIVTGAVLTGVVLFVFLVPLPINRVRTTGVVQAEADAREAVNIEHSGILTTLNVRDGQFVHKGDVLAELRNPDMEVELASAEVDYKNNDEMIRTLNKQLEENRDEAERARILGEIGIAETDRSKAGLKISDLREQRGKLTLVAPRDGVVSQCPRIEDVSKYYDKEQSSVRKPFLVISDPTRLTICVPVVTVELNRLKENLRGQSELPVTLRVHGCDARLWQGRITSLPESEAGTIPWALSTRGGGPVAVKAGGQPDRIVPQTQYFLVYVDIINPDDAITPGNLAQVKVYCKPETCAVWVWRTINNLFDLGLM